MKIWMKISGKLTLVVVLAGIIVLALGACAGPAGQQGPPGQQGPAGVSVTGAAINGAGHLVLTLSSGQTIDAGLVIPPQPSPPIQSTAATMTMGDLFSQIRPSIVMIDVTGSGFRASGTGIIIRSDGYLITNGHVIEKANSIRITLSNDQQYTATVISSDANIDLAILKLTSSPPNLAAAVLGSTADIIVGGVVIAAGFPLGIDLPGPASFTQGIVSATRTLDGQKYIQSDVQINPGNSGGALVNRSNGKIIGITTAGILPQNQDIEGIGLAIPIDVIQKYIQDNLK